MKHLYFAILALSAPAAFALPTVTGVSLETSGDPATFVKINYTLNGEPAIVTIDLQEKSAGGEWTAMAGERLGVLGGAANCVVRTVDAPTAAYWFPPADAAAGTSAANLRAIVKAWPTNQPPDYLVIDLRKNHSTEPCGYTNRLCYYETTAQFPGGFTNHIYKTERMVMRKIPAANVVWVCGYPRKQSEKPNQCTAFKAKLTKDYYMAIYPCTQGQYNLVNGSLGDCSFTDLEKSPRMVYNNVKMSTLRGQSFTADPANAALCTTNQYYWPRDGHKVASTSMIGKLRIRCGIDDIDLPTYAQWEYAARGGVRTAWPNGVDTINDSSVDAVGWRVSPKAGNYEVGEKPANNFGLYDVCGSVSEACLDRARGDITDITDGLTPGWEPAENNDYTNSSVTIDPAGSPNSLIKNQFFAGSGWLEYSTKMFLGFRSSQGVEYGDTRPDYGGYKGFRLCCSIEAGVR